MFGDITILLDQKQKYENSLEMVNNIEAKKDELVSKFNAIPAAERKNIETILPSSLDFVKLISQIDAVASKYGISVDQISSKELVASGGDSIEGAAPPKIYQSATIEFSFDTSYEKFTSFLDDLEKSLRILDIRSVKLVAAENGVYTFNVQFETYWLK